MITILMAIGEYYISGYWWLLILLYQWLSMAIILTAIGGYLLMTIGGYSLVNHWWLLMVIDGYFMNSY